MTIAGPAVGHKRPSGDRPSPAEEDALLEADHHWAERSDQRPELAFVTDAIHPHHQGGKEMRYYAVARLLADRYRVTVYTMHWWKGPRVQFTDGVRYVALCPKLALYTRRGRRSIFEALVFAACSLQLIFSRFDSLEADHMPYLQIFVLRLVAWAKRKRLVVTWHEAWGRDYWGQYLGWLGGVGWLVERLCMRLPDVILASSVETARRLRAFRPGTTVVPAPNGVDLKLAQRVHAAPSGPDVIVVGRLLSHKRIDLLLAALRLLKDRGRELECLVVGDGPERDQLVALARRLHLNQVSFDSSVTSPEKLFALIKASRVFAFPSEREGFGVAVLEAMACGVPVVTTNAKDNLAQVLVARSTLGVVCQAEPREFADALEYGLGIPHLPAPEPWLSDYSWSALASLVAEACLSAGRAA